nr:aminoglycoside phosphotransferase family protein [Streptomyces coryli]
MVQAALGLAEPPVLRPVEEGGEHLTWWVGDAYVARFAPDPAATARQRREVALRNAVRKRMDAPVPESVGAGMWAPGCGFTVDVLLPGASAENRPLSAAGEAQLAALLRGLREFPAAEAAALGVPRAEPLRWDELTREAQAAWTRLQADPDALAGEDRPLARPDQPFPAPPAPSTSPPVLAHADLKGEHLLLHPDGTLSGVLDWTDAELADPARDIAGLAISVGSPAASRIAAAAGYDAATAARGMHLARCESVLRLDDRLRGTDPDSPLWLLRRQLLRAWR